MRSNHPCDFNEFLEALQSNETIRDVQCRSQLRLSITEDEWVLLVKTLGNIKDLERLEFFCTPGSRRFHPFQAVADAVNNAGSLCKLAVFQDCEILPRDSSGLIALANDLREHTTLEQFGWIDHCSRMEEAQITAVDPVLWALPSCLYLRKVLVMSKCASADARKNLLQLHSATELHLVLETEHWLAVADEIRQGRCNVQRLTLAMVHCARFESTKAVQALASAIQLDCNLQYLALEMMNTFTDEAGVALAEGLKANKTLRVFDLSDATLGAQSHKAFAAMLRVNTSLVLELPEFETAGADERLIESQKQMLIEQRLNEVGRGRLLSRHTTREEWVDALHELHSFNVDGNDSPAFLVSCMYSLVRLKPSELFACPR
jgi:hypothetical protein